MSGPSCEWTLREACIYVFVYACSFCPSVRLSVCLCVGHRSIVRSTALCSSRDWSPLTDDKAVLLLLLLLLSVAR